MTAFKTFKHKLTGEVKTLPENYGRLFADVLEEVDPSQAHCTDCGVQPEPEALLEEPEPIVNFEEPKPRRKSTIRRDDAVE